MLRGAMLLSLVGLATAGAAGCGGEDEQPAASTAAATTATTAAAPSSGSDEELFGAPGRQVRAVQQVRRLPEKGDASPAAASVTVRPGDGLQVITTISDKTPEDATVELIVPRGAARELTISVGGVETRAAARTKVRAAQGRIELENVRYVCRMPPDTFCPVQAQAEDDRYILRVKRPSVPIQIVADVVRP